MKLLTEQHFDKMMAAILEDMMFFLKFLCTPTKLTSLEDFRNETKSKVEEEKEAGVEEIKAHIFAVMDQKEPICSALPPSLLNAINNIYIRHVSKNLGYIGSPDGTQLHQTYQEGFAKYVEEVKVELERKVKSVVKDTTDSMDLGLINDHLVIKWQWIQFGIFDGAKWTLSTGVPLLTQTVINHLDDLIKPIELGFEEVHKTLLLEIYIV